INYTLTLLGQRKIINAFDKAVNQVEERFQTLKHQTWKKDFPNIAILYEKLYNNLNTPMSNLRDQDKIKFCLNSIYKIDSILNLNFKFNDTAELLEQVNKLDKNRFNILGSIQYNIVQAFEFLNAIEDETRFKFLKKESFELIYSLVNSKVILNMPIFDKYMVKLIVEAATILLKDLKPQLENYSDKLGWQNYVEIQNNKNQSSKIHK
ncbi:MAG: hypothetical protein ACK4OM_06195, partial [Alphaproteobacteria bacterium]